MVFSNTDGCLAYCTLSDWSSVIQMAVWLTSDWSSVIKMAVWLTVLQLIGLK